MRRLKRILGGSYVIGNVMRRVLEGYSSFNFGMGIDALSRDPEPLGAKGALVCLDRVRDAVRLVVHDDGEQVVAVGEAVASRLVDEDAEFSHCSPG